MAVSRMKQISIIGRMESLDRVVRICGGSGIMQPDDAITFFSDPSGFEAVREDDPYAGAIARLQEAASRVGGVLSPGDAEEGTEPDAELFRYAEEFSARASGLSDRLAELSAQYESKDRDASQFRHFFGLDIDLDKVLACENIKVRFGRLPNESFERLKLYNENPFVLFFPAVREEEYCWGVYFAPFDQAEEVDRIFSGLYFERLRIPAAVGHPEEIVANLLREQETLREQREQCRKEITDFWVQKAPRCAEVYGRLRMRSYYFGIRRYAARHHDKFILTGWVPAREERAFCRQLDEVEAIEYAVEAPERDRRHSPPVELRNRRLFRPFEYLVGMYGTPRYTEIDPTVFIAVTYTVLFGLMFADLGQGLCVALTGWLMWRFRRMEIGRVLIPCGISAAVFGSVFGSVFGFEHVLDPVYKGLFGLQEKPIEVMGTGTPIKIILAAVLLGIALILISMGINIYSSLKQKDYEQAFFGSNGVAGFLFYGGITVGAVCQLLLNLPLFTPVYLIVTIILPLFCMFFQEPLGKLAAGRKDWKPEKWGEYILQTFFELFETLLTYLSNTMSFLRVAAFVLIHAGMMMAVFSLAGLFGPVGYIVAVILGNVLVTAMEALLVAIQVMRLEFYEMFSRYYRGDGRPFLPLKPRA